MTKNVKVTAEVYFDDFAKLDEWKLKDYIDHALIEVNGEKQEVYLRTENSKRILHLKKSAPTLKVERLTL